MTCVSGLGLAVNACSPNACCCVQYAWAAKLLDARDLFTTVATSVLPPASAATGDGTSTTASDAASAPAPPQWFSGFNDGFQDAPLAARHRSSASGGSDFMAQWAAAGERGHRALHC